MFSELVFRTFHNQYNKIFPFKFILLIFATFVKSIILYLLFDIATLRNKEIPNTKNTLSVRDFTTFKSSNISIINMDYLNNLKIDTNTYSIGNDIKKLMINDIVYTLALDTSDTTASSSHIVSPYTAYVNGKTK